ncbi:MAG: hydrolase [Acidimicrobiales bacterium]|nr:hydrolase [Acidimicrobiales bacterium]
MDSIEGAVDRVVALAEINSGTFNPTGVNRVGERMAEYLEELGPDRIESIPVDPTPVLDDAGVEAFQPVGDAVRAVIRPDARFRLCLFGHLDTVFPHDHPFQQVRRDGSVLRGPGVADCKGGLIIALEVLRQIENGPLAERVGWDFLAIPDEETGSAGSKALLGHAAAHATIGLGFEPALPSGGVAGARKGTLTAHLVCHGTSAHVGRAHHEGRSAILALAQLIVKLEALNSNDGVTVNCGRIRGGGALNAVPDLAIGSFNMRVETAEHHRFVVDQFEAASADCPLPVDLVWGSTRPPKVRNPELEQLFADFSATADRFGVDVPVEDTGGCCDGNDLAAAGLPNIDSLGIRGGAIHTAGEFADIDSIPERVELVTALIDRIAP